MAITERQRQKQLQKKNRKRALARKAATSAPRASKHASAYAALPVHECLVPSGLFEIGIGSVIVSRRTPSGDLAVSAFVVDVFCLGVKNAFFALMSEDKYEDELKPSILASQEQQWWEFIDSACMKKLITSLVEYAEDLGFAPHRDYPGAIGLLKDIEANACGETFTFGSDGKPLYLRGPKESMAQARRIVERLIERCGADGCHYSVMVDDDFGQIE